MGKLFGRQPIPEAPKESYLGAAHVESVDHFRRDDRPDRAVIDRIVRFRASKNGGRNSAADTSAAFDGTS